MRSLWTEDPPSKMSSTSPRLAVFKAWLSPTADEESRPQYISRVAELARLQDDRHRGLLVISGPIFGREKESSDTLEEKFS